MFAAVISMDSKRLHSNMEGNWVNLPGRPFLGRICRVQQSMVMNTSKLDPRVLEALSKAMDEAGAEILASGHQSEYLPESILQGSHHRQIKQRKERWADYHRCVFPGCEKRTRIRSHALQQSGPLRQIAENQHVYSAEPNLVDGGPKMKSISISRASTFPGFCQRHDELLFSSFEKRKKLTTSSDWVLQTFRTICKEIRVQEYGLQTMKSLFDNYHRLRNIEFARRVREKLGATFLEEFDVMLKSSSIEFEDSYGKYLETTIKRRGADLLRFREKFFEPLLAGDFEWIQGYTIEASFEIPICLAGQARFYFGTPEDNESVDVLIHVIPQGNRTALSMASTREAEMALRAYIAPFSYGNLGLLTMVETWMIHGSDSWYIRPSVWDELPKDRQGRLLAEMMDLKHPIGIPCKHSVFDTIRKSHLAGASSATSNFPGIESKLQAEKAKVYDHMV